MLTERKVLTITDEENQGGEKIISVDEILQQYEIKGLSLGDLQERYVNMVDVYEEEIRDLKNNIESKYEEINSNILGLGETVREISNNVEEITMVSENENCVDTSSYILLIIALIITFFVGKYFGKNKNN